MSSVSGFGICGHKNAFSTGVKIGNYVEDRIGADLARTSATRPLNKLSEAGASFIDPRAMLDKCAQAPQENLIERAMLRQGLPYDVLFEHGVPHTPTPSELATKYTPSSLDFGSGLPVATKASLGNESSLYKTLELTRAREAREHKHMYLSTNQSLVPFTHSRK